MYKFMFGLVFFERPLNILNTLYTFQELKTPVLLFLIWDKLF